MVRVRFAHRSQMGADKPRKLLALGCEGLLQAQPSDGDPQAKSSDLSCVSSTHIEKVSVGVKSEFHSPWPKAALCTQPPSMGPLER